MAVKIERVTGVAEFVAELQVAAVRRRLAESVHREWIQQVIERTGWPRAAVIDIMLAGHCDKVRLHDAFDRFMEKDNLNPFTDPPPHERFLRFLQP